jgi:hypothetical protein
MPLSHDAKRYCVELFEARRAELLKERDRARAVVRRNMVHIEDAEKLSGYPGVLQPDLDYGITVSQARKNALLKAYEFDGEELTDQIVNLIVTDALNVLQQSLGGTLASERGRMELLALRTRHSDTSASIKLRALSRLIAKTIQRNPTGDA